MIWIIIIPVLLAVMLGGIQPGGNCHLPHPHVWVVDAAGTRSRKRSSELLVTRPSPRDVDGNRSHHSERHRLRDGDHSELELGNRAHQPHARGNTPGRKRFRNTGGNTPGRSQDPAAGNTGSNRSRFGHPRRDFSRPVRTHDSGRDHRRPVLGIRSKVAH